MPLDAVHRAPGHLDRLHGAVRGAPDDAEPAARLVDRLVVVAVDGQRVRLVEAEAQGAHEFGIGLECHAVTHDARMVGTPRVRETVDLLQVRDERAAQGDVEHLAPAADRQDRDLALERRLHEGLLEVVPLGIVARVVHGLDAAVARGKDVFAPRHEDPVESRHEVLDRGVAREQDGDRARGGQGGRVDGEDALEEQVLQAGGNADEHLDGHPARGDPDEGAVGDHGAHVPSTMACMSVRVSTMWAVRAVAAASPSRSATASRISRCCRRVTSIVSR